jgi:NTE family protein
LASLIGLLRNPGSFVDPSGLRRVIEKNLPCARLEDTSMPLTIMATDLQGLGVRLSTGSAVEAVLASCAIPGVFPPVEIGGEPLMDGAVAANTPVRLAAELGTSRIIILPTGYACALKEPPKTPVGKALHAITLMIAWQLMHELENIPKHVRVHLAPALSARGIAF